LAKHLPGAPIGLRGGVVARSGDEKREPAGALLVGVVGERCVVGGDDVGGQVRDATAFDDPSDVEVGGLLGELLPVQERFVGRAVAGRQEGVAGDDAGEAISRELFVRTRKRETSAR